MFLGVVVFYVHVHKERNGGLRHSYRMGAYENDGGRKLPFPKGNFPKPSISAQFRGKIETWV